MPSGNNHQDIPTKRVKLIESGDEIVINVKDFNPELHEELLVKRGAAAKAEKEAKGDGDEGKAKKGK